MSDFFGALVDWGKDITAQEYADNRQDDAQNFNQQESQAQRDWQDTFFNTRYQRQTRDLQSAGLNPMLAYTQGPGTVPSGSAASSSPAGNPGHTSFTAGMHSSSQVSVNEAQEKLIQAQADKTKAEEEEIKQRTPTHAVSIEVMQQQVRESEERIKNIMQQTRTGEFSALNIEQQTKNLQELIPQIRATVKSLEAGVKLTGAQTTLAGAHTVQAGEQTTKLKAETGEINQRVQAQLPALQSALAELERQAKVLQMPGRHQEAAVSEGFSGALSATLKALSPLTGFDRR